MQNPQTNVSTQSHFIKKRIDIGRYFDVINLVGLKLRKKCQIICHYQYLSLIILWYAQTVSKVRI